MNKLLLALLTVAAVPAVAADYKCTDKGRVEKKGAALFTFKQSATEIVIEKGGSMVGKAVKRGTKWHVEIGGKTEATFENGNIDRRGARWTTMSHSLKKFDCKLEVATTLWVLEANDVF
ncbi:MAG: hypothetical protein Q8S33_30405 [Myxococcales bacterium]|nr:hypothetical protein [Myxococcales bacterium]